MEEVADDAYRRKRRRPGRVANLQPFEVYIRIRSEVIVERSAIHPRVAAQVVHALDETRVTNGAEIDGLEADPGDQRCNRRLGTGIVTDGIKYVMKSWELTQAITLELRP